MRLGGGILISLGESDAALGPGNVTYFANGGTFEDGSDTIDFTTAGGSTIIAEDAPVWEGHEFKGWIHTHITANTYEWIQPGESFYVYGDYVNYMIAQWSDEYIDLGVLGYASINHSSLEEMALYSEIDFDGEYSIPQETVYCMVGSPIQVSEVLNLEGDDLGLSLDSDGLLTGTIESEGTISITVPDIYGEGVTFTIVSIDVGGSQPALDFLSDPSQGTIAYIGN